MVVALWHDARSPSLVQLFEFLSDGFLVTYVASRLARGVDLPIIAKQLFALARKKWLSEEGVVDDITVVIVLLEWQ